MLLRLSGQFKVQVLTEYHDNITAAKQEISQRIALPDFGADFDGVFKIHRGDLAHAHRNNRGKSALLRLNDDYASRLNGLSAERFGVILPVPLFLRIPCDHASRRVVLRDYKDFFDSSAHLEMISVIVIDIEQCVGHAAVSEGVSVPWSIRS